MCASMTCIWLTDTKETGHIPQHFRNTPIDGPAVCQNRLRSCRLHLQRTPSRVVSSSTIIYTNTSAELSTAVAAASLATPRSFEDVHI